ncbi:MAG: hypothetical protein F4227_02740 [Gammaproteobacteria bacterium]|nr:hypothetical protein [Gammaproteobacteria bacterium]MYF01914.1 hypothetical protein [Gammaproteobacteria bacterium]MYI77465.1 hypothetical protein [Gammaproteobacteria bacterium]
MTHYWTWRGTYFGYRRDNCLFTHKGKCIGHFSGEEIYGRDGRYLGEVRNKNRLITNKSKFNRRGRSAPNLQGGAYARYANYAGFAMYAGFEDFPEPESFSR